MQIVPRLCRTNKVSILLVLAIVVGTASSLRVSCFRPKIPYSPHVYPTTFKDCLDAIKKMLPDEKMARVPLSFSREEGHGFQVPREWSSGGCYVIIDVEEATDEETANFNEIAVQSTLVNSLCVARPPHLGGTTALGVGGRLNVTLMGGLRHSFATKSEKGTQVSRKAIDKSV